MKIQIGAQAPTGSACLEKVKTLVFTDRQAGQIRAAREAYRRLFTIRATAPEWSSAYAEWQLLAESVAAALISHMEAREVSSDDATTR